jgi:hypothetical protein
MSDNLQPVINKVLLHLHDFYFVQGKPLSFDDQGHMDCVYSHKDSDGREITRCAFGALLGPLPIPERWEGESITSLLNRFIDENGSVVENRMHEQGFWPDNDEHKAAYIRVLCRLQTIHDHAATGDDKELFAEKLREMFTEAGLEWPDA